MHHGYGNFSGNTARIRVGSNPMNIFISGQYTLTKFTDYTESGGAAHN